MTNLEGFSIRTRVGYATFCLELILTSREVKRNETWNLLLDKLWTYTNCDWLDDWQGEIVEYIPDVILIPFRLIELKNRD
jgi:hypothetical protein